MHREWRIATAALVASLACACAASGLEPYSLDRSVVVETSPVDPSPIERHHSGRVEACTDAWALARIQWYFREKEALFWSAPQQIEGFVSIREVAYRPWGYGKVPRRYCTALALLSDDTVRPVQYSIIEKGGFSGVGSGVEWCVEGLDREWGYAPNCRMARP